MTDAGRPEKLRWRQIQSLFRLDTTKIHLAAFLLSTHPRPVRKAIKYYRNLLDRNPEITHQSLEVNDSRVLHAAADFFGVDAASIALTDSTTMGLGLIYSRLKLSPENLLTTAHDHYSSERALQFLAQEQPGNLPEVTLYDAPASVTKSEIIENLVSEITEDTRLVALTWVHSSTGVKIPLRRIYRRIQELNDLRTPDRRILVAVDGVHALGVENFELGKSFCDFFVAGSHKLLCGPRGTGVIWATDTAWEYVSPTIPPFGNRVLEAWRTKSDDEAAIGRKMTPGGYHSFEYRWALADAFELQQTIGRRRICQRLHRLAERCKRGLASMPHVNLLTPLKQSLSSAFVCFNVQDWEPQAVERYLFDQGIVTRVSPRHTAVRICPGLYTRASHIRRALETIDGMRGRRPRQGGH